MGLPGGGVCDAGATRAARRASFFSKTRAGPVSGYLSELVLVLCDEREATARTTLVEPS